MIFHKIICQQTQIVKEDEKDEKEPLDEEKKEKELNEDQEINKLVRLARIVYKEQKIIVVIHVKGHVKKN